MTIHGHLLTPAGQQLARIANCEPKPEAFDEVISWIRKSAAGADLYIADIPSIDGVTNYNKLDWQLADPANEINTQIE